jgi:hypothetical protein
MSTWKLWPQGVVRSIVLPFSAWLAREEFFQHAIALIGREAPLSRLNSPRSCSIRCTTARNCRRITVTGASVPC